VASQLTIATVLPGRREPPAMALATGVADHFLVSFSFHDPNAEERHQGPSALSQRKQPGD